MSTNASPIPTPTRVGRLAVYLRCQIDTTEGQHWGAVSNLSYGGFGIELENSADDFDLVTLLTVKVDILGEFDVEVRWSRGNRMGVRFTDEACAIGRIQDYLDANGLTLI